MKKGFILFLVLLLTLSLGGCKEITGLLGLESTETAAPGKTEGTKTAVPAETAPTPTDSTIVPTATAPTGADPTAPAPTETQPKIKGVNVIDAFNKTEEFGISWSDETFTCSFAIPAIDLDSDNARAFNQTIYNDLYPVYEASHDPEDDLIYSLSYVSSVYKGVVAILTDTEYMLPASEYMGHVMATYYYDVATDRPLDSDEAYVNKLGYTMDQLQKAAERTREYQELNDAGIYSDEERYDWDSVTLSACILHFDRVWLLFDCAWSFSAEGETYVNHNTVVKAVDANEFLPLV